MGAMSLPSSHTTLSTEKRKERSETENGFPLRNGTAAWISNLSLLISVYRTTPDTQRKDQAETRPIQHSGPFFDHRTLIFPGPCALGIPPQEFFISFRPHLCDLTLALVALLLFHLLVSVAGGVGRPMFDGHGLAIQRTRAFMVPCRA